MELELPPDPSPVARLAELVGHWRTEGHLVADPDVRVLGTDTYELSQVPSARPHRKDAVRQYRALTPLTWWLHL